MSKPINKELIEKYRTLIAEEKEYIKQQCFDFSQIPAITKRALKEFALRYKDDNACINQINNVIYDNFLILEGLYTLQKIRKKQQKNKTPLTKKDYARNRALANDIADDDKAYTYSTKQTRELLYLCSLIHFKDGTTLLDKLIIDICFEKVDLYHPGVNLSNIKYIVNNLSIEYICVDIPK